MRNNYIWFVFVTYLIVETNVVTISSMLRKSFNCISSITPGMMINSHTVFPLMFL
jgi:hypothetical protein